MKALTKLMSVLVAVSLLLCGCSSQKTNPTTTTEETESQKNGGTVKMACVPVDTLNPLITQHSSISDFLSLVYEGLFVTLPDLTTEGVLATEYAVSEDNTVYTIKLKEGVKFHNGKEFSAEDVVATIGYISSYGGNYYPVVEKILGCDAPSSHTVTIILKSPVSDFMNSFDFPILPAGLGYADFLNPCPTFYPVGTGMYIYDGTLEYKNIYLKANTNWHSGNNRPHIDKVDIEILSDDSTVVSAFDAGAVDVLTTSWQNPAEINLTSDLYNTYKTEQNRFTFLGINTGAAAFDTKEERVAFSSHIDSKTLCDDIMLGSAVAASSPVRDNVYFNEQNQSPSAEDETTPDNASATVSYSTEASGGQVTELYLLYNSSSKTKERLALAIKHRLDTAGYPCTLDPQPYEAYLAKVAGCEYDLYVGEVSIDNCANLSFMFGEERNLQNVCTFYTSELSTLVSNLNRMSGKENKGVAWVNFKKYYNDECFQVPLYFTNGEAYVNKRISGKLVPNISTLLYGFENLYLESTKTE